MTEQPLSSGGAPEGDASQVEDQWSAVINVHDCNLNQIEVALQSNMHALDPHPADSSRRVRRHPVYLVAENYAELDSEGNPSPGRPTELDLEAVRGVFNARYPDWVAGDGPPGDGSHVRVRGMFFVAEHDSAGNPTGRVFVGDPEDAPQTTEATA